MALGVDPNHRGQCRINDAKRFIAESSARSSSVFIYLFGSCCADDRRGDIRQP